MKALIHLFFVTMSLLSTCAFANDQLTAAERNSVIKRIQALIESDYVMVEQVERVNRALSDLNASGKYDNINDREAFAEVLTEDLRDISSDKHYGVGYKPELIASRRARAQESEAEAAVVEEPTIDWNEWYAAQDNFGVEKAEVLDGNIGYLKITFFQPLDWMQPVIDSAMAFVANTDALIIDLTKNGGGYSPSDSYLGSFFFDPEPVLWSTSYYRPTGERSSDSTFAEVGAPRYLDRPVVVLVGPETFSLGEKFAYSMKHFDKAVVVGEVTAGAANGISFSFVDDNFVIQIPAQRTVNPITQTNFEGAGVQPNVAASADEAFNVAYGYVLDRLIESAEFDRMVQVYKKAKAARAND